LLQLTAAYAQEHGIRIVALHVHHGLSPHADAWVAHCQEQCHGLGVTFDLARVSLADAPSDGIESAARQVRYQALGDLCRRHHVTVLLTAHHQDDQAETMLLQLLRGAGVAGLCGMQKMHFAPGLLGSADLLLARPLLTCARSDLERFAAQVPLLHVEDESNSDTRFARNALRHQVMPVLEQYFPGFQARFARTAQHAQSAQQLLEQMASADYAACLVEGGLDVEKLRQLNDARGDNVLRHWLASHQAQMPSTARLMEIRKHSREDAKATVKHGAIEVHRYRHRLEIAAGAHPVPSVQPFHWQGEASLAFPMFFGTLHFVEAEVGIARDWLLTSPLELRPRQGGERLRLAHNRPSRDMKSHYQTSGIPFWQRERLPFVFFENQIVFAAGFDVAGTDAGVCQGIDAQFQVGQGVCVLLRWEPNPIN
jgi:tRNA(Ile)-lysidine synthase